MAVSDFLSGGSLSRGVLRQQNNQEVKLTEEQEQSLLQSAGRLTMGGLSAAANFLDLPGSMIRDVLALENPLDQVLSPFSDKNRTTGEDLLQKYGLMGKRPSRRTSQSVARFGASLAAEIALDPLTYLGPGALTAAGKIAKRAGILGDARKVANRAASAELASDTIDAGGATLRGSKGMDKIGNRQARMTTTLRDLLGEPDAIEKLSASNKGKLPSEDLLNQKLGGLLNVHVPFLGTYTLGTGARAQRVAGVMDTVTDAVSFGKYSPVRLVNPIFRRGVRGAMTGEGQKAAIETTELVETYTQHARDQVYKQLVDVYKSGVLDGPDGFDNHLRMLDYLEGIEPDKPLELAGIAKKYQRMEDEIYKKYGLLNEEDSFDLPVVQTAVETDPKKWTPEIREQMANGSLFSQISPEHATFSKQLDDFVKMDLLPKEEAEFLRLVYSQTKVHSLPKSVTKTDDPGAYGWANLFTRQVALNPLSKRKSTQNVNAYSPFFKEGKAREGKGHAAAARVLLHEYAHIIYANMMDASTGNLGNSSKWLSDLYDEFHSMFNRPVDPNDPMHFSQEAFANEFRATEGFVDSAGDYQMFGNPDYHAGVVGVGGRPISPTATADDRLMEPWAEFIAQSVLRRKTDGVPNETYQKLHENFRAYIEHLKSVLPRPSDAAAMQAGKQYGMQADLRSKLDDIVDRAIGFNDPPDLTKILGAAVSSTKKVQSSMPAEALEELSNLRKLRTEEYAQNGFDYKPQLTPELEKLQPTLDMLKIHMRNIFNMSKRSGVAIEELDDPIEYFARLRQTVGGPMRRVRDANAFAPSDAFTLGRDRSMRGMMRGTALLQKMSVDKEFAGVANLPNFSPEMRKELRNKWRQKYGLVQQDTMFGVESRPLSEPFIDPDTGQEITRQYTALGKDKDWQQNTDRLFDKITKLDRKQVEAGIPMFATNPAEVALKRFESAARASAMAIGVRRFVNNYAEEIVDEEEGFVRLSELFGNAGNSSINQGHKEAKELMISELGELSETIREKIVGEEVAKALPSMVKAQLQAMHIARIPKDPAKAEQLMLDILAGRKDLQAHLKPGLSQDKIDEAVQILTETGGTYDSALDFMGTDWAQSIRASISPDDILARVRVPEGVAADAARVNKAFQGPESFASLVAATDAVTNWFKTNVTATAPSFHVRNYISGQTQNIIGGAYGAVDAASLNAMSLNLMRGKKIKGVEKFIKPEPGLDATETLQKELFVYGVMDSPGSQNDLVATFGGRVADQIPGMRSIGSQFQAPEGTRWRDAINPLASTGVGAETDKFLLARWGRGIGNVVEGMNRISAYIGLRKQGYSPMEAAKRTKELQVDYTNLSDIERRVIRRAVPFYSFTKGAASFVVRELADKPGGRLAQTLRATENAKDVDATTPQYVAETTSIPLGQLEDGSNRYITGLGLMHEAPLSLFSPNPQDVGLSMLSQLNPIFKGPLEYATGQSFFQTGLEGGRPLKDTDPLLGRIASNVKQIVTGEEQRDAMRFPREIEMIAANSPASRYLSMIRQATDTRKDAGSKAAMLLLGPRFTDVSPAAQDAILREQASTIMERMGAKDFTRTYVPDYIKEKMTPEQLERIEQWEALQSMLADRAKARKLEREAAEKN